MLARQAGPERARAVRDRHDDDLLRTLFEGGYLDLANDLDAGPLEAALVTEDTARALGAIHVGARSLVAPAVLNDPIPARIALADAAHPGPIRFGAGADVVLVLDGPDVRVLER